MLDCVSIADGLRKSLPSGFDHAQWIGNGVWDWKEEEKTIQGISYQNVFCPLLESTLNVFWIIFCFNKVVLILIMRNELEMESETEKKKKNMQGISYQNVFFPLGYPFKTSANLWQFLTPTPLLRQFFTTIRRQIWPIFDPSPPKKCRRLKWMLPY